MNSGIIRLPIETLNYLFIKIKLKLKEMKKISLLTMALLISLFVVAQQSAVDKLFEKYEGKDGFTIVSINKGMFDMLKDMDPEDEDLRALAQIEYVKVLAVEDDEMIKGVNFYDEIMKSLNVEEYEELLTVKQSDQDVKILVKQTGSIIKELLIVVGGADNALVYIKGNIQLKDLSGLSNGFPMHGLEALKALEGIEEEIH